MPIVQVAVISSIAFKKREPVVALLAHAGVHSQSQKNIAKRNEAVQLEALKDMVNKPSHYHKNAIDVIGYLEQHFPKTASVTVAEGFFIGNIIKYVSRYKEKNGLEDLEKAMSYLTKLIDLEQQKEG